MSNFDVGRFVHKIACMPEKEEKKIFRGVERLEAKRKELKLSKSTIARLLQIPENTLSRWLYGIHKPTTFYQRKIEQLLSTIETIQQKIHHEDGKSK